MDIETKRQTCCFGQVVALDLAFVRGEIMAWI